MKRTVTGFVVFALLGVTLLSCGGYNSNANGSRPSGLAHRVFVSDPVFPSAIGGSAPALAIVDTSDDQLSPSIISLGSLLSASIASAGMMSVSPKRDQTLVFSAPDNKLGVVSNSSESFSSAISLPGPTESFFWTDNATVFAAIPAAPVNGQAAGVVLRLDIPSGSVSATIPIPGAHYIAPSPDGSKILVFSDNSNAVTLIVPSLIGAGQSNSIPACGASQIAVCTIPVPFDRPVGAVFNASNTTAFVLNCGAQCGGTGVGTCLTFTSCTSVSVLDLTQNPPAIANTIPVPGATIGLLQGSSLYVAGTPAVSPDNNCSGVTPTTSSTVCGRLTVINTQTLSAASVAITDGYHDRMAISSNGQLFVGSRNCTNINLSSETRGCLTIANVTSGSIAASAVIAPPENGDVTGIEPITNRNVVYVCQGGALQVYDTTTDKLEILTTPPDIVGQAVDVKMVDF